MYVCGKSKPLANKCPCLKYWQYAVLIGQAGHKKENDCQSLSRQGETDLQKFYFIEMSVEYSRPVG